jgi:hypothetical protein
MSESNAKTAKSEAQMLDSYVRSIGGPPRNPVSYWPRENPICIRVIGQPSEWADYVKARIRYDGLMADAPMDRIKCRDVTLQIVFADQFDAFVQNLAEHNADAFGYKRQSIMWSDLATVKGPAHVWYKKYDDDDLMIASALIIIDKSAIRGMAPTAVADYIAFISLSQVKTNNYMPAAPTILNLISGRGADGAAAAELSDWDRLYLKSIYGVGLGPDSVTTSDRVEQRMRSMLRALSLAAKSPTASPGPNLAALNPPLR